MTRKPKTTSAAKPEAAKPQAAKAKTSETAKPVTRRSAAPQPPAPGADNGGEYASPACSAHEVDPTYMMAPSKPAPSAAQEKPKAEPAPPAPAAGADNGAAAAKAPPPKPSRVPFNQGPKPGWADRHTKSPHNQGRGRMRVGRPHGRGQGG